MQDARTKSLGVWRSLQDRAPRRVCGLFSILFLFTAGVVRSEPLVAFSLGRAEECLKQHCSAEASQLSGITHLLESTEFQPVSQP